MEGHVDISGAQSRLVHEPPLPRLYTPGAVHARVTMSVGTQLNFGEIKVTATVSYECDQVETKVDEAGLMAFSKALELMNDALTVLAEKTP